MIIKQLVINIANCFLLSYDPEHAQLITMVRLLNDLLSFIIPLLSVIGPIVLLLFFGTVNIIDDMQRTLDDIHRDS